MGIFDLFGRDAKPSRTESFAQTPSINNLENNSTKSPVAVFNPTSYNEVEQIIDCLKSNKTAIVHLNELKTETALRILDMLSGAVYAINGGVYEMEKNIFMFSPSGVEIR